MLNRVYSTKFLGVSLDCKLTWKVHIDHVKSKLNKCLSLLFKSSWVLDTCSLKLLYYSLFFPYVNYCCEVWGNAYKTSLTSIVCLQKRALRIVCKVRKYDHTAGLFKRHKILPFSELVKFKIHCNMYKGLHGKLPAALQERICVLPLEKRRNRSFKELYCRTSLKSQCFSIYGPKLYNNLPSFVTVSKSDKEFRCNVKTFLFSGVVS